MSTKNVFIMMLRNLRSMNDTLGIIAESLGGLLSIVTTLPTEEDLTEVEAAIDTQQAEIVAMQTQIQIILDNIKIKKK